MGVESPDARRLYKEAGATVGTYELVYRGHVCNCQGRLIYQDGALVALNQAA